MPNRLQISALNIKKRWFTQLCFIFITSHIIAQGYTQNESPEDSKIFKKNSLHVIKSQYLDKYGYPSHEVFLTENGLNQYDKTTSLIPYFTVSILKLDLLEGKSKMVIRKNAALFNLDFYVEKMVDYKSLNKAIPVWDGRVYQEDNRLIIGGYSDKYNERPVGHLNAKGNFISNKNVDANTFPILDISSNDLLFDPFKKRLFQIEPSNGINQTSSIQQFLPIDLYGKNGGKLQGIRFDIESQNNGKSLILMGIIDGKKIKLASCNIQFLNLVGEKEAFRPELITGASQPGSGEMVTLTFRGVFSESINLNNNDLYLNFENTLSVNSLQNKILIDGNFNDWRNVRGISDVKGDYVSYLYANPDTDLLEFKVTNDDKYMYFYSRVVGAHGRTGEKGRYYWYTYMDVDSNPETGYPPTRDDNCYFGIAIGDDCEAQFEFIGNKFIKTFFGFTGMAAEEEILRGELELGASYYSRTDKNGEKRDYYKMEYVHRENSRFTTEDYTEGTSEDIIISLSPDGSEVEVKVELEGFLKDRSGKMLVQRGQKIDIAVGVEGSSKHYGSNNWGADSSAVIYGYVLK